MKKLLVIGYHWPEPNTTAAGHRMLQLLHAFKERDFAITFASTAQRTPHSEDLAQGLGIVQRAIVLNHPSFDEFICELAPDVVLFDRFITEEQFGWRVAQQRPKALRILNTEDLHSLRKYREHAHAKGLEATERGWLGSDMAKREVASIYRCDLSLLVSTFEQELLERLWPGMANILYHLPFLLEALTDQTTGNWKKWETRQDVIFFGNGKHAPNLDAIKYLKNDIWPKLRKRLPAASLHIYGAYLPQHILEMHQPATRFLVHGWAPDLAKVLGAARVHLAPLRFGAGIKGKLTEAMRCGTPSVTSNIGTEGMHGSLPWSGGVAQDTDGFVQKATELFENKALWQRCQQGGLEILNALYNRSQLLPPFFDTLATMFDHLERHREQNVIGQLLQHHSLQSTKYLSKWIQEKGRRKASGSEMGQERSK
ncbi:glycosyltransferase [Maribacter sp. 2307ULW6-5]|uniref:glycosyltransferase n=1 Tax=Maribacter sp. 2307ULW6-5 TaxID=3386275 RepID=UPI0039BC57E6